MSESVVPAPTPVLPEFGKPNFWAVPEIQNPSLYSGPISPELAPWRDSLHQQALADSQIHATAAVPSPPPAGVAQSAANSSAVADGLRSASGIFVLIFWLAYFYRPKPVPKTRKLCFNNCFLGMTFRDWLEKNCSAGERDVSARAYDNGSLEVGLVDGSDLQHPAPIVTMSDDKRHFSVKLSPRALTRHRLAGESVDFTYVFRCSRPDLLDSLLIKFYAPVDKPHAEQVHKHLLTTLGAPDYADGKLDAFWLGVRGHKAELVTKGDNQPYAFVVSVAV